MSRPGSNCSWRRSVRARIRVGLALGATALGVTVALAGCGGSSKSSTQANAGAIKGQSEVSLQPVSKRTANPFTAPVGKDLAGVQPPPGAASANGAGLPQYSGSLPGLYGGTRNYTTCDAAKLVRFLERNPAKAQAWAATLGIRVSQISDYVSLLTPVLLRTDTRVTNHGYIDGQADAIQAVLEAGTAVFVDQYGAPVVKCYCGNPLTPPIAYTAPTYVGRPWPSFSATHITIIQKSTTIINEFTLYDPSTGTTFTQPAGANGSSPPATTTGSATTPAPQTAPAAPAPRPNQPAQPTQTQTQTQAPAESPSASFSPNPGTQGDTFVLSVSGFAPGAQLDVQLQRPDGVNEHYSISVASDGTGSHSFGNTGSVITGTYSASITNASTGASATASVLVQPASTSGSSSSGGGSGSSGQ